MSTLNKRQTTNSQSDTTYILFSVATCFGLNQSITGTLQVKIAGIKHL